MLNRTLYLFKYFYGSVIVTFLGFGCAFFIDEPLLLSLYLILLLALLEVSLSFDNAVVNAKVLSRMPAFWQQIFIWIGLPIAVFGMRLIFPILLVDVTTSMSFSEVLHLAMHSPQQYKHALTAGMPIIAAFGGSFLLMVFLKFLLIEPPETSWFKWFENARLMAQARKVNGMHLLIALMIGVFVIYYADRTLGLGYEVAMAFLLGVLIHESLFALSHMFGSGPSETAEISRHGLMGFMYLEILDASFSFDGVIGGFAISSNIFIIMIGLAIGAMFVRSLTVYFVVHKTLSKFVYLEHGAHYAIGFLALVMFLKVIYHVPEWITGTIGISLIAASFFHSIYENRKNLPF